MKEIIITLMLMFTMSSCFSQDMSSKVDSFYENVLLPINQNDYDRHIRDLMKTIKTNEEASDLIQALYQYKNASNYGKRLFSVYCFDRLAESNFTLKVKQSAALERLDMFYTTRIAFSSSYSKNVYTDKCKQRIKSILKGSTKEEKKIKITHHVELDTSSIYWKKEAIKLKKINGKTLEQCMVIITQERYAYWEEFFKNDYIDYYMAGFSALVKLLGWFDDKRVIPFLKALPVSTHVGYNGNLQHALARLGDKVDLYTLVRIKGGCDIRYLQNVDALILYLDKIDRPENYNTWGGTCSDDDSPQSNNITCLVSFVTSMIKGYPYDKLGLKSDVWTDEEKTICNKRTKEAIEWVKQNKDTIEIKDYDDTMPF